MKKDIAPEVLAFLKTLPIAFDSKEQKRKFTEEDEARIKIMLNNSISPQAQADRKALKQYILNSDFKDNTKISNAEREAAAAHLRKYALEFYKQLLKTTS